MRKKGKHDKQTKRNNCKKHHASSTADVGSNDNFNIRMGLLAMKQIIDNETGEIIEVKDDNEQTTELLTNAGVLDKEVYEIIDSMLYYQDQFEIFRGKLEDAMRENGIKKWDNDYFTATVKEDYLQKRVDTERLKKDGLYENYLKLVPTKGSLSIKFKKGV